MARKTVYVDDLDGSDIADGQGGAVIFSLGDQHFRIDLSDKNRAKLEKALEPYVSKAERIPAPGPKPMKKTKLKSAVNLDDVRSWARSNGHTVSDRGRIPGNIMEAYEQAKGL